MEVTIKADMSIHIEDGKVVILAYDNEDTITFKEEIPLYELIADYVGAYQICGTDRFKLDAEDRIEFENLQGELDDALTLVTAILENAE